MREKMVIKLEEKERQEHSDLIDVRFIRASWNSHVHMCRPQQDRRDRSGGTDTERGPGVRGADGRVSVSPLPWRVRLSPWRLQMERS
ncbi:unnamed protein product [Pleuronectes platessa]|uniref:Uncharacterized protein n=1 Tax=Pleuronectes platessa TaxID=8262 RepID=A0A9N7Z186_PLEPL|nr:unnamed protein product [Pleuronectes platessa]